MYLASIFKTKDGKTVVESCIHTDPLGKSVIMCIDHNTP